MAAALGQLRQFLQVRRVLFIATEEEEKGSNHALGRYKDETKGRSIFQYIGLRPKLYAFRFPSEDQTNVMKKAKGIKRSHVESELMWDQYKDCLFENTTHYSTFNMIRSKNFELTSREVCKKSLSDADDKRKILDCGIKTLAYGHFRLKQLYDNNT